MQIYLYNWAEIFGAIICTICFIFKPSVTNRWFVWFLWLTVCIEITGKLTKDLPSFKLPMYNIFTGVEFIFYWLFFLKIITNKSVTKIIKVSIGIFVLVWVGNFIFFQQPFIYNTYTATISAALLCLFCLLYFYDTIALDNEAGNKWSKLLIVSGIFIFYAGSFKLYASFNLLIKKLPKDLANLYNLIANNLNAILYGLFAIAFIIEFINIRTKENSIPLSN